MADMHRAGASIAAIARHWGCAWKTVAYVLDKPCTRRHVDTELHA